MFSLPALPPSARPRERQPALPTGMGGLDAALGGGLPRGQLVELSGGASSGKSTRAFGICLQALAQGSTVFWIQPQPLGPRATSLWPLTALEAQLPLERFFQLRVPDGAGA